MSPRLVLLGGFSAAFASALRRALPSDEGWEIRGVPDATAVAAALASGCPPAFVLLDAAALGPANLPALCRSVRRAVPSPAAVRLEVLLPDLSPASVRAAYAAGVDECRVGPVSAATLALFVLAKTPPPVDSASDAFRFDPATGVARLGGRPLDLTSTEVRLLRAFVSHPGIALSRGQLLRASLGDESGSVQPRAVDSAVAALRCKLGSAGWRVETAWGHAPGVDIDARRGKERWLIEIKGPGSRQPMRVNYFLSILGETLQRMDDPAARYSIALPDMAQYRGLWERLPALAKERTAIDILFVDADGNIENIK